MESKKLVLLIDVGNTNTVIGLTYFNQLDPIFHKRTVTKRERTSDELGLFLQGFIKHENFPIEDVKYAIYSSVVPGFNPIVERMVQDWFRVEPMKVVHTMNLPFTITYPRPFEIGADRLVNAAICAELYTKSSIIIDMGTATTFCVLNSKKEYVGGVIAPGLKISMENLHKSTAQLPPIVFQATENVVGKSTIESLQSGFYYGWIGLLEKIITEIKTEFPTENFQVVGTGGLVSTIHQSHNGIFDIVDNMLTLKGLKILFDKNASS